MASSDIWDDRSIETKIKYFQQNPKLFNIMEKIHKKHKERYILALAQQRVKLPTNFDVTNLKWDKEDSPLDIVTQKLQDLQMEMEKMKRGKIQPTKFNLKKVCPLPFDKNITFMHFLQNVQIPNYDKYFGTLDPPDHLRQFHTLSMKFFHDMTYLMWLFPRSLGGQAMEWFSKIPSNIKTFDQLASVFISQYLYNIKREVTMIDLCNMKQLPNKLFKNFL